MTLIENNSISIMYIFHIYIFIKLYIFFVAIHGSYTSRCIIVYMYSTYVYNTYITSLYVDRCMYNNIIHTAY